MYHTQNEHPALREGKRTVEFHRMLSEFDREVCQIEFTMDWLGKQAPPIHPDCLTYMETYRLLLWVKSFEKTSFFRKHEFNTGIQKIIGWKERIENVTETNCEKNVRHAIPYI
jgi:hypothetical protein